MLRLAAQAPCRSGPVTSTLGLTDNLARGLKFEVQHLITT
jgi:hypothetical protein